jgi:hypothetical protein
VKILWRSVTGDRLSLRRKPRDEGERRGTSEKVLFVLTALGALLVVALALFALSGSRFVPDLLRGGIGSVLGMPTVWLLTRSPRRGRRIAALVLPASSLGTASSLVTQIVSPPADTDDGRHGPGFVASFIGCALGASLWRLLDINPLGPRGDQAPRRRV